MNPELVKFLGLAIFGTIGASIATGIEMGLYSINRVRLNLFARTDRRAAVLKAELDHPGRLLASLLISYNLLSYIGAIGFTGFLESLHFSHWQVVIITGLVIGPILFVIADGFPKEAFRLKAEAWTLAAAIPLRWLRIAYTFSGILPSMQFLARSVSALLGGGGESGIPDARERISQLLKEGAEHGVISEHQATLLDRALAMRETTVGDEMIAWERVQKIVLDWPRQRVLEHMSRHRLSRYPVVRSENSASEVIGVLSLVDFCLSPSAGAGALLQPVTVLHEETSVREGLEQLRDSGSNLAIVVRAGRAVGIVTSKDLVEPLTGELKVF